MADDERSEAPGGDAEPVESTPSVEDPPVADPGDVPAADEDRNP